MYIISLKGGLKLKSSHALIGREDELELIKGFFQNAATGTGSTVLISGEAGIGKSRLLEEFRIYAEEQDSRILAGGTSADIIHPFLLFSSALEGVLDKPLFHEEEHTSFTELFAVNRGGILMAQASPEDGLDADIFAGMLSAVQNFVRDSFDSTGQKEAGLGRLEYGDMKIMIEHGEHLFLVAVFSGTEHPDMKDLLRRTVSDIEEKNRKILDEWKGNMEEMENIQSEISSLAQAKFLVRQDLKGIKLQTERIRIAGKVLETIAEMSEHKSLVIILEDLHWADESSLFVFNFLANYITDRKILILGTQRPGEGKNLEDTLNKMDGQFYDIQLKNLEQDNVSLLLNELYSPNKFPAAFIEKVSEQCEGNPFFLIETFRQMLEEGSIKNKDGVFFLLNEDYSTPDTVEDLVHRRLEMLEPGALALAEYSSCIGRSFEKELTESFLSIKEIVVPMNKLQDAGILIVNNGTASFSHAIFHDVIYNSIADRWKFSYHRSIGEYYEDRYKNEISDVLYELAKHFSRSNESQKSYDYCMKAGEKAESAYAPEQAMEFFNIAQHELNNLRLANKILQEETIKIDLRLGTLFQLVGKWDDAEKLYQKGMKIVKNMDNKKLLLDTMLGQGSLLKERGEYDEAIKTYKKAGNIAEEIGDKLGLNETYNGLGNICFYKAEYGDAADYYGKYLELSGELEDMIGMCSSLTNIGMLHAMKSEYDEAMEHYEKAFDIAEKHSIKRLLGNVNVQMGLVHYYWSNYEKAIEFFKKTIKIGEEIGNSQSISYAVGNMGVVYKEMGNYQKAMESYKRTMDISEQLGDRRSVNIALGNIGILHMYMGEYDEALQCYQRKLDIAKDMGANENICYGIINIGELYLITKKYEKGLEVIENAMDLIEELDVIFILSQAYLLRAGLNFGLGNFQEAEKCNEEALKISQEAGRNDMVHNSQILKSKLIARTDKEEAAKFLKGLLEGNDDETEIADIEFQLWKVTGEEEHRMEALALFPKLYEKTPKIEFKEKIDELNAC